MSCYILKLEDECFYVGFTRRAPQERIDEHFLGLGAKWTQLHKPLEVLKIITPGTLALENMLTRELLARKGRDKVRGGSFCQLEIPPGWGRLPITRFEDEEEEPDEYEQELLKKLTGSG